MAENQKNKIEIAKPNRFSEFFKVQVATLIALVFFISIPLLLPSAFSWISNQSLYLFLLFSLFVFQLFSLIATEFFHISYVWKFVGFVWVISYIAFIYITGGLDSPFIFLMVIIPIISIYQLEPRVTRNMVILSAALLALLIFTDPRYLVGYAYLMKYAFIVFGYILIGYYIYQFVNETLSKKVESEQLKRRIAELDELDHTKQVFLSAMSHQLRTPLNAAKWGLEEALKNVSCPDRPMLEESHNRVEEAIGTISKILKTAELEIDKANIEVKNDNFHLDQLIRGIVNKLDYIVKSNGISLDLDIVPDLLVKGDEKMLDLALANIVDNAFRYSPYGRVKISLTKGSHDAVFSVEDNGIGIDPSDLPYVANQKFYRGKNAMAVDPNESGIGLYTTQKIVELHGGKFSLASVLGQGTKVSVSLPLA